MGVGVDEGYAEFVEYHELQLRNIGLPEEAWRQVYEKLQPRTLHDLSSAVKVEEEGVFALKPLQPYSAVFVVPHEWSGNGGSSSFAALEEDLEQPGKLLELLPATDEANDYSLEDQVNTIIQDTASTQELAKTALDRNNGDLLYAIDSIISESKSQELDGKALQKALNIPDKPSILSFDEFKSAMVDTSNHQIEMMYNDYVRKKQREIGDDGWGTTAHYKWEDDPEEHMITVTIPVPSGTKRADVISKITSKHWSFAIKGSPPIISGNFYGIVQPDECTWYFEKSHGNVVFNIQKADTEVFMWKNLIVGEEKLCMEWLDKERRNSMLKAMDMLWYHSLTYQAVTPEGKQAHNWYLPPISVTKMGHSKNPNFKLAPFWSCYGGKIITLLWPIRNIHANDCCNLNKVPVLFTGEKELQIEARRWACNPANISKPVPASFTAQYNNLVPPHGAKPSSWAPDDDNVLSETDDKEDIVVVTSMVLLKSLKDDLEQHGITIGKEESPGCFYFKCGREDRKDMENVNSFDSALTNLIRLNQTIRSNFGDVSWWPSGYHLNKELAAVLAAPTDWDTLWLLRCSEGTAASVVTNNAARLARMCENSLNYFAQPFINSLQLENCQCCLEFTVIVRNGNSFLSDIPAVHKARLPTTADEHTYQPDHYISRSDDSHFPSTPWANFLIEFSLKDAWPDTDLKVQHILHDLFSDLVKTTQAVHCYGVQMIITPDLQIKLVGINPSPTYFPSPEHLASAWKIMFWKTIPVVKNFRSIA